MRKKLRHKSNIKVKFGLFMTMAATILTSFGWSASPVSAKVWTLQEILDNKKVLDAEADHLCTDGEGDDYTTDPLCDKKQYEKFIVEDPSDPLRTSDRIMLNLRTKEFAENTITITYVDPSNLEIKLFFNDRNYNEYGGRSLEGGTPHYSLSSLELQWLGRDSQPLLTYSDASSIIPNQETTIQMTDQPELYRNEVITDFNYSFHTLNPTNMSNSEHLVSGVSYMECVDPSIDIIPFRNPYREGMVCIYTNADEDPDHDGEPVFRAYLPDGTLPPAEKEPEPTYPDPVNPDHTSSGSDDHDNPSGSGDHETSSDSGDHSTVDEPSGTKPSDPDPNNSPDDTISNDSTNNLNSNNSAHTILAVADSNDPTNSGGSTSSSLPLAPNTGLANSSSTNLSSQHQGTEFASISRRSEFSSLAIFVLLLSIANLLVFFRHLTKKSSKLSKKFRKSLDNRWKVR